MKNSINKKHRLMIIAAILVFVAVMSIWIGILISKNIKLSKELDEKQAALDSIIEENTELEALVDEENETALMEEYARKAGYVYPDERVYINEN